MQSSVFLSLRAGLTGLVVAAFIYLLWKISLRIHGFVLPERYGDLVIAACGILLWIIWFGMAQVILIAFDETNVSLTNANTKGQNYLFPKQARLTYARR